MLGYLTNFFPKPLKIPLSMVTIASEERDPSFILLPTNCAILFCFRCFSLSPSLSFFLGGGCLSIWQIFVYIWFYLNLSFLGFAEFIGSFLSFLILCLITKLRGFSAIVSSSIFFLLSPLLMKLRFYLC